ncbi:MAG: class II aldolase/adducin family protein [Deltaproteobacteria bacterium]|nr:class II aldolase/adducin family protein [Deltaproteobacteria bacterium]
MQRTKEENKDLKETLALACRILGTHGHDDLNLGHLSARVNSQADTMYMKGRGLCLSEVFPEDLVTIDFNYRKLEGMHEAHGELPIHVEIYKRRKDVNCVVHTHPIYCTAFSASGQVLRPINNYGALFARPLPCFDEVTDLIVTPELGQAVADRLGDQKAIFLKNHGIVVVGETIEHATVFAHLLELTVKTFFIAKVFGEPSWTEDEEAEVKAGRIFTGPKMNAMWEALRRQLEYKEAPLRILKNLENRLPRQ